MTLPAIWLPDGERIHVEWFLSSGRAVGVESISDAWVSKPVGVSGRFGFEQLEPCDPERDELLARAGER